MSLLWLRCRCDCVWVCVYVGGVVNVVECDLFFESGCVWVDCERPRLKLTWTERRTTPTGYPLVYILL